MMTQAKESSRQELLSMLTENRSQEMSDYADQTKSKLLSDWISEKGDTVRKELRLESAKISFAENYMKALDESRYAALKLGTLLGTIESLERIQYEQNQNLWAEASFSEEPVKHLPQVVQALETHGPMSHSELCTYLGMKTTTLTEAMKKIVQTGAVHSSNIGKYKIYSLSDSGLRYGKELRKNKKLNQSLDELCEAIKTLLMNTESEKERNSIKASIQKAIYTGDKDWIGAICAGYMDEAGYQPTASIPAKRISIESVDNISENLSIVIAVPKGQLWIESNDKLFTRKGKEEIIAQKDKWSKVSTFSHTKNNYAARFGSVSALQAVN